MAIFPVWWFVLLAIPVIGSMYYGLFIIGHDGIHGRLFEKKWLNNLYNDFFVLGAIGAVTHINNKNHLLHHLHLTNPEDPDRHKHGCFNKADRLELFTFLLGLSSIVKSVKNVFLTNARLTREKNEQVGASQGFAYSARDIVLLLGWQVLLFGGLTYFIAWWAYPVLWLFPVYAFAFLGDNLRSFAEHSHPESDDAADEHRLITYISNPIERMFISPMNMNFHAVHHLWVSIPYYNLPAADREIRSMPEANSLEWRGSYLAYILRYYLRLPLDECRQNRLSAAANR